MPLIKVSSHSNTRLKTTRLLGSRAGVIKHSAFILEGAKFVADYLSHSSPKWIILSEKPSAVVQEMLDTVRNAGDIDILEVSQKEFSEISNTEHSQGVIAVCPLPTAVEPKKFSKGTILILDKVTDPGNMGTAIRSAAGFGCIGVVTSKGCCHPFAAKATRASTGMNTLIPIFIDLELPEFMQRHKQEVHFVGAEASGGLPQKMNFSGTIGLVVGSEAHGISENVRKNLDGIAGIPMEGNVESLNASVSASILLYYITEKQRNY